MKLKSKIFYIVNPKGEEISIKGKAVALDLNGQRSDIKLKDIISHLEFDSGEFYGNSLLSYYQVNEDGSLQVEGSKVQLVDEATGEPILIKKIEKPGVHDDGDMPFEHVQKFAEFFKIAKPEEVFTSLSEEEKQTFISERAAKAQPAIDQAAQDAAAETETAALELEAQKKANAALKASIHPSYVQEQSDYNTTQSFYAGLPGYKEHIKEKYHLFYGPDPAYPPCVLIKHGEWWEELTEENTEIMDKTDKTVVIDFKGINQNGKLTLDNQTGDINITDVEQY